MELLAARGVTKYFPETDTLANDDISLSLSAGELRAVVGENGAGKSTLAKILAGLLSPDAGEVLIRGSRIRLGSVREAEAAGLGYVPQHSLLADRLTVAENLVLGHEPRRFGFFDRKRAYVEAALLVERFGFRLDPGMRVADLSPAERRHAEIARALARGGEVLILDEPTSILAEAEADALFALLGRLAQAGKGILFITHRLAEVGAAATAITVLREGRVVADLEEGEADESDLFRLMTRCPDPSPGIDDDPAPMIRADGTVPKRSESEGTGQGASGDPVIEAQGLVLAPGAAPLSFSVRAGEILGVAALAGNGLDRLEDYVAGMKRPARGAVLLLGRNVHDLGRDRLRAELFAYVAADREGRGLCLDTSVRDNVLALRRREFPWRDWIGGSVRDSAARTMTRAFSLAARPGARARSLSGGNRQRLLLARELDRPRPAMLLAEPFQGLDAAAQAHAVTRIRAHAKAGSAIVVLSSSLEELFPLADRVAVLYRGSLVREGSNEGPASAHALLAMMTGLDAGKGRGEGAA